MEMRTALNPLWNLKKKKATLPGSKHWLFPTGTLTWAFLTRVSLPIIQQFNPTRGKINEPRFL
jgi:hypothetical protein